MISPFCCKSESSSELNPNKQPFPTTVLHETMQFSKAIMIDLERYRFAFIATLAVLLLVTLVGRWQSSGPRNSAAGVSAEYLHIHMGGHIAEMHRLRCEYLGFFISTVMNLQYNYFPGYIDGNEVPPNAVALSMAGMRRLDNFALSVATVINDGIQGHIIETGAWRGGASFVAAKVVELLHESEHRTTYICDSFKGIPKPPTDRTYNTEDHNANFPVFSEVSAARVYADAVHFGMRTDSIKVVEGYFNESLPALVASVPNFSLSVLRLDGDTYFSTMDALKVLYPRLQSGGIVIVDDFIDWIGCREAVDDYRKAQNILDPIVLVPHREGEILRGAYWRKGSFSMEGGKRGYSYSLCLGGKSIKSGPSQAHNELTSAKETKHSTPPIPNEAKKLDKSTSQLHLLVPKSAYIPTILVSVPREGPKGLKYDVNVFKDRTDLKMCVDAYL